MKLGKRIFISNTLMVFLSLVVLLAIGGEGFVYYSYAGGADGKTVGPVVDSSLATIQNEEAPAPEFSSPDQETVEIKPEATVGPGVQDPDTVDIANVPVADIHIPLFKAKASLNSSLELIRKNVLVLQKDYGLHIRSLLTTAEGDEIRISRVDANMGVSDAIESLKSSYSPETSELTEINGLNALYVDGEVRKVVHLITEDHLYTIAANTSPLKN